MNRNGIRKNAYVSERYSETVRTIRSFPGVRPTEAVLECILRLHRHACEDHLEYRTRFCEYRLEYRANPSRFSEYRCKVLENQPIVDFSKTNPRYSQKTIHFQRYSERYSQKTHMNRNGIRKNAYN